VHQKHEETTTQNKLKEVKTQDWSPLTTSGLETERTCSQRKRKVI